MTSAGADATYTPCRLSPWIYRDGGDRPVKEVPLDRYQDVIRQMEDNRVFVVESVGKDLGNGGLCKVYLDWDNETPVEDTYGAPQFLPRREMRSIREMIDVHIRKIPLLTGKTYTVMKRAPRPHDKKDGIIKFSYRILFNDLITDDNTKIGEYFKSLGMKNNEPFDLTVYDRGRGINPVYCRKPQCDLPLDPLWGENRLEKLLITVCDKSIPLIKWDEWIKQEVVKEENYSVKYKRIEQEGDDDTQGEREKIMKDFIEHTSVKRADNYESWLDALFSFINIGKRYNMRRKANNLFHQFSAKSAKYDENEVEKKWDDIERKARDTGYGIAYLRKAIKEDDPVYYENTYEKTYSAVKKRIEKMTFKVMNPVGFFRINPDDMEFNPDYFQSLSRATLMTAYENEYYYGKNKKGEYEKMPFIKGWLADSEIKTYERIIFEPTNNYDNRKYYNIFTGFRAKNLPDIPEDKLVEANEGLELIRKHILEVYCDNNEEYREWLENWLASPIQQPKVRTGVAVIFHGKQGIGKNMVLDAYANGILGEQCSYSTGNPADNVFARFNSALMNKILLVCNEAGSELYNVMDKLKDLLTSETLNVEKKGKDIITFQNYLNIMMTTNNVNPLYISKDDRRLVWFGCSNKFKGDNRYFTELKNVLEKDIVIRRWYDYLATLKLKYKTTADFQMNRPITDDYRRLQDLNTPPWMVWLSDCIQREWEFKKNPRREAGEFYHCHKMNALYDDYKAWCDRNKAECKGYKTLRFNLSDKTLGCEVYLRDKVDWISFTQSKCYKWLDENRLRLTLKTEEEMGWDKHDWVDSDNDSDGDN